MLNAQDISGKLAFDTKSVDNLRLQARKDPDQALKEVAQQFEAIFVQMMLKSMREATPKNGIFDSQQSQFYTQMLDQQLVQDMSAKGIGLADMMIKQLTQSSIQPDQTEPMTPAAGENNNTDISNLLWQANQSYPGIHKQVSVINSTHNDSVLPKNNIDVSNLLWQANKTEASEQVNTINIHNKEATAIPNVTNSLISPSASNQPAHFVRSLSSHAKIASEATGIPANFMIAQAALESGWGKHEILHADNKSSFNLFGIKAGQSWQGAVVETVTTEYINGEPKKITDKFRAYNSYAESFQDYANLLINNPRYAAVLKNQDANSFAHGLQQAGYATDPLYADKLIRIINSNSLRDNQAI